MKLPITIIKIKELKRLRDIDETFISSIKSKQEEIDSLKARLFQLNIKYEVALKEIEQLKSN